MIGLYQNPAFLLFRRHCCLGEISENLMSGEGFCPEYTKDSETFIGRKKQFNSEKGTKYSNRDLLLQIHR